MDAVKNYFKKKNLDRKFKRAGDGHVLAEESEPKKSQVKYREPYSDANTSNVLTTTNDRISQKVDAVSYKDTERGAAASNARAGSDQAQALIEVQRVILVCPFCKRSKTNSEIQDCMRSCLNEWHKTDPIEAAASRIKTLNRKEAVDTSVATLSKYINNIIADPDTEKYRKIRSSNKIFQEKVADVEGSTSFLLSLGFTLQRLPFQDSEEDFYYLDREKIVDVDVLKAALLILTSAEAKKPTLDKDMRVYRAASAAPKVELPSEFYTILASELKQEQTQKSKAAALESELRTKAMRKRDEGRISRHYLYTIIRVKFPDDVLIQGTFHSNDALAMVFEFINSCLCNDAIVYTLSTSIGKKLDNDKATLSKLDLVPSCVLHVSWDVSIMAELQAVGLLEPSQKFYYLKNSVKFLIQELH
ncbi:UBX domain-containing protein 6 [Trichoplax sp. H2]|nr:UBX domain-containing protein 6 [Trichoplax sp. H2]|eukprot:RDD44409.1 UBX domain-containing protein 6 [Trichoplax sp. H2]